MGDTLGDEHDCFIPLGARPCAVSIIDAGFFYYVRRDFISDDVWSPALLEKFCDLIIPKYHWRFRTYYVDAYPPHNPRDLDGSREKRKNKDEKFREIERLDRFSAVRGESRNVEKPGFAMFETLPEGIDIEPFRHHKIKIRRTEQKQVDVLLASLISRIAYSGESKHITLIAGDQDFIPAIEIAKNAGVIIRLICHDSGSSKTSSFLKDVVDERKDAKDYFEKLKEDTV